MKKCSPIVILTLFFVVHSSSSLFAVEWKNPPPAPAKVITKTPSYNWFNPTKRQYYGNRIPGTKYCSSGCTKNDKVELNKYNKRVKKSYKKGLKN